MSPSTRHVRVRSLRLVAQRKRYLPDPVGVGSCAEAKEQQVAFSFTKNLLGDGAGADDLAALFKAVYQALEERAISYGQGHAPARRQRRCRRGALRTTQCARIQREHQTGMTRNGWASERLAGLQLVTPTA